MWVDFVVGSLLAPRGFSPGSPVFPSPVKPMLPNSNLIWNAQTHVEQAPEHCSIGKQITFTLDFGYINNNIVTCY